MSGKRLDRLAESKRMQMVLPTICAWRVNSKKFQEPIPPPDVFADVAWHGEAQRLLERSEQRLSNLEAKGPGLAATAAIIGAGVLIAAADGWNGSLLVGKLLLVLAMIYLLLSLVSPLALANSLPRSTIIGQDVADCSGEDDPAGALAMLKVKCAAANDMQSFKLANIQSASRDELVAAIALIVLWGLLGPVLHVIAQ